MTQIKAEEKVETPTELIYIVQDYNAMRYTGTVDEHARSIKLTPDQVNELMKWSGKGHCIVRAYIKFEPHEKN